MRGLSPTLEAAQEAMILDPRVKITFSDPAAVEDDVVVEEDRVIRIPFQEEGSDKQNVELVLDNSPDESGVSFFTDLNLKGWDVVFEWGLVTATEPEYSAIAPLKVISQYLSSSPGILQCRISLAGIPNLLAEDKANKDYFHHWSNLKPVKEIIAEIADGQPVETELIEEQTEVDGFIDLDDTEVTWFDEEGEEHSSTLAGVGQRLNISRTVTKLAFRLKKTGLPSGTNVIFRIRRATGDEAILGSKTFPIASIGTSAAWCEVTFDSEIVVDEDVWIYIEHTEGTATKYISVRYNSRAIKPDEHIFRVFSAGDPGAHWEDTGEDLAYRYKYTGDGIDCFNHCQAYVVYDTGNTDSLYTGYLPKDSLRIYEGEDRLSVINRLLYHTSSEKIVKADGKIHIFEPKSSTPYDSDYSLAEGSHTFFSKAIREALVIPNRIVVHSLTADEDQFEGEATDPVSFALLPISDFRKTRLISHDQGGSIAAAMIARLVMAAQRGAASMPMNLGSEVFDYVRVTDSREDDSRVGNLGYIRRSWNPRNNEFNMAFNFGRLPLKSVAGTRPSLLPESRPMPEPTLDEAILRWGMIKPTLDIIENNFESAWKNFDDIMEILNGILTALGWVEGESPTSTQILLALVNYYTRSQVDDKLADVSHSLPTRALDTEYRNTSGKLLMVVVTVKLRVTEGDDYEIVGSSNAALDIGPTSGALTTVSEARNVPSHVLIDGGGDFLEIWGVLVAMVHPGHYYEVATSKSGDGDDPVLDKWSEYKLF